MPSEAFANLGAEDLGSIAVFLKSVPPVDNKVLERSVMPLGRVMVALGLFGELVPAQLIDHQAPIPAGVPSDGSAEYGGYLVSFAGCSICHGDDLGGDQPGDPDSPRAPAINSTGAVATWTEGEFADTLRTGRTPGGNQLDAEFMPWEDFAKMTDDELKAIWLYIRDR